jgi:hypothetical protein
MGSCERRKMKVGRKTTSFSFYSIAKKENVPFDTPINMTID